MLTERRHISEFTVFSNGNIGIRQTIDVFRNGEPFARQNWRVVLGVNDPHAEAVLGEEPYYYQLALQAWAGLNPAPTEGEIP